MLRKFFPNRSDNHFFARDVRIRREIVRAFLHSDFGFAKFLQQNFASCHCQLFRELLRFD